MNRGNIERLSVALVSATLITTLLPDGALLLGANTVLSRTESTNHWSGSEARRDAIDILSLLETALAESLVETALSELSLVPVTVVVVLELVPDRAKGLLGIGFLAAGTTIATALRAGLWAQVLALLLLRVL